MHAHINTKCAIRFTEVGGNSPAEDKDKENVEEQHSGTKLKSKPFLHLSYSLSILPLPCFHLNVTFTLILFTEVGGNSHAEDKDEQNVEEQPAGTKLKSKPYLHLSYILSMLPLPCFHMNVTLTLFSLQKSVETALHMIKTNKMLMNTIQVRTYS